MHLLDYTPGGPDFRPDRVLRARHETRRAATPARTPTGAVQHAAADLRRQHRHDDRRRRLDGDRYIDIGGRDEVHGESGDDTVYTGCGNDVIFGDGAGRRPDRRLGQRLDLRRHRPGRRPRRRRPDLHEPQQLERRQRRRRACTALHAARPAHVRPTRTASASRCTASRALPSRPTRTRQEPGRRAERVHLHAGPGAGRRRSTSRGALKKEVDITPYNLGPNPSSATSRSTLPLFDANNSDDVIYGGWDDDFLHGGSGDDAIAGGEALHDSYVQHFHRRRLPGDRCEDGLVRTDWTRPYNPRQPAALRRRRRSVERAEAVRAAARRVLPLRRVRPAPRDPLQLERDEVALHELLEQRPHVHGHELADRR